jgi:hypothetical protein
MSKLWILVSGYGDGSLPLPKARNEKQRRELDFVD